MRADRLSDTPAGTTSCLRRQIGQNRERTHAPSSQYKVDRPGNFPKGAISIMTPSNEFTLGLDLAQNSFAVAAATDRSDFKRWRHLPSLSVDHPPDSPQGLAALRQWMEQSFPGSHCARIVVESTGPLSRRFVSAAADLAPVAIINPRYSKALGQSLGAREKTDATDAAILAVHGLLNQPEPTRIDAQAERLRELNRLRQGYLEDLTRWSNRVRDALCSQVRQLAHDTADYFRQQLHNIEEAIDQLVASDPDLAHQCRCLGRIAGIGPVTARTLTAELGDLRHYGRNQLVALAGVFPCQYMSGESVWRPARMAKGGGGRLRRVLYMCATSLLRSKGVWAPYIDRMRRRGASEMLIIGALMRKLLLVARAVMMCHGDYFAERIGREQKTLA